MLKVNGVSKSFAQYEVLSGITFEVNRGEILGLLGESGSGKSTLLRIIAGLLDADLGQIFLKNKRVEQASEKLIPGHPAINIVHQDYNLFPQLTVFENIAYILRFYEKSYQQLRTEELIELCHLNEAAYRPAKLLSGGEKQRTAIACAIAEKPQVLLLDEPFAHIDLPNRNRLSQTIQKLVKQLGLACIFVTHDSIEALALSSKLGVLKNGKIEQIDLPQIIYQFPKTKYIAELTGEANYLKIKIFENIFGTKPHVLLPDKLVLVRPEQIAISEISFANSCEAIVMQVLFCGSFYKVQVIVERQKLWIMTFSKFHIQQKVFIGKESR